MDLQLKGKKALVVASSKGIGKGIATELAREGCDVIISSSSRENLTKASEDIYQSTGKRVTEVILDVTNPESVADTAQQLLNEHGRIDILVNNCPGPKPVQAMDVSMEDFRTAMDTILISAVTLTQTLLQPMIDNKFGRIIFLASSTAKEPDPGLVLSNVTRAGVLAYAKTLSREVGEYGVTVNSILTGGVLSDRTEFLLKDAAEAQSKSYEEVLQEASEAIPAGYISTPEQFAQTIVYLVSPRALYVTGVSLPVDGGFMKAI